MKKQPEICDFTVPSNVFVNMHNGDDYTRIPLSNLDINEVRTLCTNFTKGVYTEAGFKDLNPSIDDNAVDKVVQKYTGEYERKYKWLLHNMGLVEEKVKEWNPAKHKPLIDFLNDFIEEKS